jgi:hypothetical protein
MQRLVADRHVLNTVDGAGIRKKLFQRSVGEGVELGHGVGLNQAGRS